MNKNNAELVLHPVRLQLMRALARQQMSISQLLNELKQVPIATAYRHINKLLAAGLIYVSEERLVKGTVERIFALPKHNDKNAIHQASKEQLFHYFSTFVATLLDDYKYYLEASPVVLSKDVVDYRSITLYLSDEELAAMARDLHQAMIPYLQSKPECGRVARIFSTVLIPKQSESRRENECAS